MAFLPRSYMSLEYKAHVLVIFEFFLVQRTKSMHVIRLKCIEFFSATKSLHSKYWFKLLISPGVSKRCMLFQDCRTKPIRRRRTMINYHVWIGCNNVIVCEGLNKDIPYFRGKWIIIFINLRNCWQLQS